MQDVKIIVNDAGARDIAISDNGDLETVSGFDTSIDISLYTNKRAGQTEVIQPFKRRGWIGDLIAQTLGFTIGSKLWLFEQRRLDQNTINDIRDAADKSLSWLIDIGAARDYSVAANKSGQSAISFSVEVRAIDNSVSRYSKLWTATGAGHAN